MRLSRDIHPAVLVPAIRIQRVKRNQRARMETDRDIASAFCDYCAWARPTGAEAAIDYLRGKAEYREEALTATGEALDLYRRLAYARRRSGRRARLRRAAHEDHPKDVLDHPVQLDDPPNHDDQRGHGAARVSRRR